MLPIQRVLLVARWPVGGIRTYFRYIYSQEGFENIEFTFLMPDEGGVNQYLGEYCPKLRFNFIDSGNSTKSLYSIARKEIRTGNYDLVHSHGYTAGAVVSSALILNKRTPHLMTAHDVFLEKQFFGWRGKAKKLAMALAFSRLDKIHAVSDDCATNFLEFFPKLNRTNIHTILHGVDTERFYSEPPRDFRSELTLNQEFLFGFFGRFMAQKGFNFIVDAVESLVRKDPSWKEKIKVLTFGWGGFVREEFEEIERRGLSDIFIQMPHTDNMPAAIKGVDAVLMPSLWEACGLLGMESLSAGTPIVGASCIGLREVLDGSPALVVEPKKPVELLRAIEAVYSDNNKQGFEEYSAIARQRFSLKEPAHKLLSLYCSLV